MSYKNPVNYTVGINLRAEMVRRGKTPNDLASLLQISTSSAQRRLAGETGLNLDEVAQLMTAWGIDINDLVKSLPAGEAVA